MFCRKNPQKLACIQSVITGASTCPPTNPVQSGNHKARTRRGWMAAGQRSALQWAGNRWWMSISAPPLTLRARGGPAWGGCFHLTPQTGSDSALRFHLFSDLLKAAVGQHSAFIRSASPHSCESIKLIGSCCRSWPLHAMEAQRAAPRQLHLKKEKNIKVIRGGWKVWSTSPVFTSGHKPGTTAFNESVDSNENIKFENFHKTVMDGNAAEMS